MPVVLILVSSVRRGLKKSFFRTWLYNAERCSAIKGGGRFFFVIRSRASCSAKRWMKSLWCVLYPCLLRGAAPGMALVLQEDGDRERGALWREAPGTTKRNGHPVWVEASDSDEKSRGPKNERRTRPF